MQPNDAVVHHTQASRDAFRRKNLPDIFEPPARTGDGALNAGHDLIEVAVRQRVHVRRQRRAVRETVAARVEHILVPHLAPAGDQVLARVSVRSTRVCVCEGERERCTKEAYLHYAVTDF